MALAHATLCNLLAMLMSELSEEHMTAGWEGGLECTLWDALQGKPLWTNWQNIRPDRLEMLREMSAELGGWLVSDYDEHDKDYGNLMHGLRFVPLSEWQEIYAKRNLELQAQLERG